jgi:hypothetical protein
MYVITQTVDIPMLHAIFRENIKNIFRYHVRPKGISLYFSCYLKMFF